MILLADPVTRKPLPAFVPQPNPIRPLFGPMVWRDGHSTSYPHHQEGGNDTFDYVRKCRRDCCAAYWEAQP